MIDTDEYNLIYNYFSTQSSYKWYHLGIFSNEGYNWTQTDGTSIGLGYGCWFLSPTYFLPYYYNYCSRTGAVTMYAGPSIVLANVNSFFYSANYICRKN
jgi:hypothetical protein